MSIDITNFNYNRKGLGLKNLILIIGFLILSNTLYSQKKPVSIWGIEYGASQETVEEEVKKYNLEYKSNPNVLICVNAQIFGENARIIGFQFHENKLYKVIAAITPASTNDIFDSYNKLKSRLTAKYGRANYVEEIYDPPYEATDTIPVKVRALEEERLMLISKWTFKDESNALYSMMLTINEKPEIIISYRDERIDAIVEE